MPSPTQSNTLARIQPGKLELPSLEQMRADLLSIENDVKQPTMIRLLAGSQRTIVDHLRLMVGGQRMMAQSLQKYVDGKMAALVAEINAVIANGQQEEAPTEVEPTQDGTAPVTEEVQQQTAPAIPTPPPAPPQMTITPVARKRTQQPAAAKAGAK